MNKDPDQTRNLNPHKFAVAAMWLYGRQYADQRGGSMDFWDSLSISEKSNCQRMVIDIENARKVERRELIEPKQNTEREIRMNELGITEQDVADTMPSEPVFK